MSAIDDLISALQVLPGVGPKSAQRMTLYLLQRQRQGGAALAHALERAVRDVQQCGQCRNFTEHPLCRICQDPSRDPVLCVVESPADVLAIEQAGGFRGRYFVLHGKISPLDGIGPDALGIDDLVTLVQRSEPVEVILATNPTVEGEATAHYIAQALHGLTKQVTRIAHGVSLGSEIEYTDGGTLAHAFQGRKSYD